MVGHDFLNFPFYIGNIRLKLKCSDCTLLSDGIAKHQNIEYFIGFKGSHHGWQQDTFSQVSYTKVIMW